MELPSEIQTALARLGLVSKDQPPEITPLPGGVSSDIWLVELAGGPACIKRALAKLKVAAEWRAPVERNANEVAWIEAAGAVVPASVPRLLGHDPDLGFFVMAYLDPARFRPWKDELRAGRAEPEVARAVGACIGRIHAGTAGDPEVAARFATDDIFHAIRLEPYLEAAGRAHPDCGEALARLVRTTADSKRALVHGDVSPKNILIGPNGPVFLDAECAWYGDPAFDLAFCLNHLLLKCLWTPSATEGFLACYGALAAGYLAEVDWEPAAELEARAAGLLPGLLLARVDGKSPVEYLVAEADKDRVRRVAKELLLAPANALGEIAEAWRGELETCR